MKRFIFFIAMSIIGLAANANEYLLNPKKITENTWVIEGSTEDFSKKNGGNIVNVGFILTPNGVVLIDTGPSFKYGQELRKTIERITGKKIILVLLTHHHPDHVLGNQAFHDVPIAALTKTTDLLHEQGDTLAENMYRLVGDWMRGTEVVLPTEKVQEGILDVQGYELRVFEFKGHSGADLVVLDEATGVLFTGDIVFYQRALTTPHTPSIDVWLEDIERLNQLDWKYIVPGHGPIRSDRAPLIQMREYLLWLDQLFAESAARGLDMNQVLRSKIPDRFKGVSLASYELIRTVSHLYPKYERQYLKLLN